MEKEIFEQPDSIDRALGGRIDRENATAKLGGLNLDRRYQRAVSRVNIIAAGTSWHASLVGAQLLESIARIPAAADVASELRYRNPVVERDSLWFAVSQSGETADTLYAMREIQRKGAHVLGICNVVGSTIARESDGGVYVHSGPEIAVASTKAFTSQLAAFYLFTLHMARMRDMSRAEGERFLGGPGLGARKGRGRPQAAATRYRPSRRNTRTDATSSSSAGVSSIRSPSRAPSSSRRFPISTPRATRPGRSSTDPSPSSAPRCRRSSSCPTTACVRR